MMENSFGDSRAFFDWLSRWYSGLKREKLDDLVPEPGSAAVMSVDLVVGFCYEGALASPRVASIVPNVVKLFKRTYEAGIRNFLIFQDSHPEEAEEFSAYGPHCVEGSREAEMVPELRELPFSGEFMLFKKNSLSSSIGTGLDGWLERNKDVNRFIVVGDCTDLCVYQLAMHLRLSANAYGIKRDVIVPADCVQTYDLPVEKAESVGLFPHDGDLLHALFLYHMALNGIRVTAGID